MIFVSQKYHYTPKRKAIQIAPDDRCELVRISRDRKHAIIKNLSYGGIYRVKVDWLPGEVLKSNNQHP